MIWIFRSYYLDWVPINLGTSLLPFQVTQTWFGASYNCINYMNNVVYWFTVCCFLLYAVLTLSPAQRLRRVLTAYACRNIGIGIYNNSCISRSYYFCMKTSAVFRIQVCSTNIQFFTFLLSSKITRHSTVFDFHIASLSPLSFLDRLCSRIKFCGSTSSSSNDRGKHLLDVGGNRRRYEVCNKSGIEGGWIGHRYIYICIL